MIFPIRGRALWQSTTAVAVIAVAGGLGRSVFKLGPAYQGSTLLSPGYRVRFCVWFCCASSRVRCPASFQCPVWRPAAALRLLRCLFRVAMRFGSFLTVSFGEIRWREQPESNLVSSCCGIFVVAAHVTSIKY